MLYPEIRFPGAVRRLPLRASSACLLTLLLIQGAWSRSAASAKPAPRAEARSVLSSSPASASPQVDSTRVRRLYLDGEFDAAIAILEENLKEARPYRHEDSVFIFKHLGVMYAAQNETREKGKYYMHKLLSVEPTAKIMDMYASDMIYMIFKNIQEEFESNENYGAATQKKAPSGAGKPVNMPARERKPVASEARPRPVHAAEKPSPGGKKWVWIGAAAATMVGVGAYYVVSAEPEVKVTRKDVPF